MRSRSLIPALCITLIVSYGSLYYAFAVLARPIRAELGWTAATTVGAYSIALLIAGLSAFWIGNIIDQRGGRRLMAGGSVLACVFFVVLSQVNSLPAFYVVWAGLGIAMALTQYEAAFAVIVATYPNAYRNRIGILAVAGGFASALFWPLTHTLVGTFGWRGAVITLGLIHLVVSVPLYWYAVPDTAARVQRAATALPELPDPRSTSMRRVLRLPQFWLLTLCFTSFSFVNNAMTVHVIPILESRDVAPAAAVAFAALVGPMQVCARFADVLLNRHLPVLVVGSITVGLIPFGIVMLWAASGATSLLYLFVIFYGAGLGLITITRAGSTAEFFGHQRYGAVSGLLTMPSAFARALGPVTAASVWTAYHDYNFVLALIVTVGIIGALGYWSAATLRYREQRPAPAA